MITFFRTDDCPECDAVEESLVEMSLAHKIVRVTNDGRCRELPAGTKPPVLVDGDECFEGDEIHRRLEQLREVKADWDRFGSDACYCDNEGNVI